MEMGFGDMDSIYLFKNKVQCRNFAADPSASNISAHLTKKVVNLVIYLLVTWRAYANRGDVCYQSGLEPTLPVCHRNVAPFFVR
jgi:hypothetical protein